MRPARTLAATACVLSALAGGPVDVRAQAAGASAPAAAPASAPAVPVSAAKRELAKRWLAMQQDSLDKATRSMVEAPARQLLAAADPVLRTQVPAAKREAAAKQIQADARKYVDELMPTARQRAQELGQSQMLPAIEAQYTEDELRQIVTFFESPVFKKLQQTQPPIEQALGQKLLAGLQPTIETKARALQASMAKTLGVPAAGPAGGASGPAGTGMKPSSGPKLGGTPAGQP